MNRLLKSVPVVVLLSSLLGNGAPALAQAFLDNTQAVQAPTWLQMASGGSALNSTAAQGNMNNSSGLLTGTQSTFNPLTAATQGKLPFPSAPNAGTNNLLAPNSVGAWDASPQGTNLTYGKGGNNIQGAQPPAWNYFPSGSYTYGFPTVWPAIPGGIYKGQDAYLPPTSTSSVDANIVDLEPLPLPY